MTPRRLQGLIHKAAAAPSGGQRSADRAAAVWQHIRRGWDPERIEWQRWLRRWWPWVAVMVVAVAALVAALPHGPHEASAPPPLRLFSEALTAPAAP